MELPQLRRNPLEILRLVDPHTPLPRPVSGLRVLYFLNGIVPLFGKPRHGLPIFLHQMQPDQSLTQSAQRPEQISIRGKGQAREIDLEKFSIAFAISRRVKNSVHVVENVLRAEG